MGVRKNNPLRDFKAFVVEHCTELNTFEKIAIECTTVQKIILTFRNCL